MATKSPWLTDDQQRAWRGWLGLSTRLPTALHRQLYADSELSLPDFEVLVRLTESPGGRVRVTELAEALQWERSRLSHHVRRMETRGLVAREECENDGRGAFVVVTEHGRGAIADAAPGHARTVRELFFSDLTDGEVAAIESVTAKVLRRLEHPNRV
jgi:DNA-binding MarR family transcriptional regulator